MNLTIGNNKNVFETFSNGRTEYQRNRTSQSNRTQAINTMIDYGNSIKGNNDLNKFLEFLAPLE